MLKALYRSPALRAAVAFGMGGATFTVGNLILARVMSKFDYGVLSLVVGILAIATICGSFGLEFVISRRGLQLDARLRRRAVAAAALVGVGAAVLSAVLYHIDLALTLMIFVATIGLGVSQCVAAHFQGQRQFSLAIPFNQFSSWVLLLVGIIVWLFAIQTAELPILLITITTMIVGASGWRMIARRTASEPQAALPAQLWSEAISLVQINVAGSVLLQLERLVIPKTIGIENLALFGVVASLVGSAFRMLYSAVHFTVIPRLRDAATVAQRRSLLRHEALVFSVVMVPASAAIWFLAPPIAHWFLAGRYDLDHAIMLAMIVSGLLKLLSAFGTAIVSALAQERELWLLSIASWLCIALSVYLAFVFRQWGVSGAIYAVSVGWLGRTLVAFWISLPYLRQSAANV